MSPAARSPRVVAIASRGGHWMQLRRLKPAFDGCRVTWISTDRSLRAAMPGERLVTVPDATRWNPVRLVLCAMTLVLVLVRERPQVIVSTGAAPGFLALRIGRLLGARTVWIDSIANAEVLSLSGQKAARFADLTLTQWPELGAPLPPPDARRRGEVYCAGAVL